MTRIVRDADGTPMVRDVDGDWVPVDEPEPTLPGLGPNAVCEQHDPPGERALRCRACWSEIKAGERPMNRLGRTWPIELRED